MRVSCPSYARLSVCLTLTETQKVYKIMQRTPLALHCRLCAGTRALRRSAPGSAWDAGDLDLALPLQHLGAEAAHVCHKPQVAHHLRRAAQSNEGHWHAAPDLHHMQASLHEVLSHQPARAAQGTAASCWGCYTHSFKPCQNAAGIAAGFAVLRITCSTDKPMACPDASRRTPRGQ